MTMSCSGLYFLTWMSQCNLRSPRGPGLLYYMLNIITNDRVIYFQTENTSSDDDT